MKPLVLTTFLVCVLLAFPLSSLAQSSTQSVPSVSALQSKHELDEAARAYREGHFAEAQLHSERALQLDPESKGAPLFIARTIHAQYKPGDFTPENVAKAHEAILAYQRIFFRSPNDDEAYKAIAYLYAALKEDELLRDWILRRGSDVSIANDKRADAYVVLASKDWDCSFKITELPSHKVTTVDGKKAQISYRMPEDRAEYEQANECATRGLQIANLAIALAPENESAWSYKTNILLELVKLAEMSGDTQQKTECHRQYEEALAETTRLAKGNQAKR